ncbi:MAG: branched-chain amino acid aminotransferase [Chitinophagaceae bacterium]|nr:branched-chain amino acid aminotransferase [Chitinophagaceae bacterium]
MELLTDINVRRTTQSKIAEVDFADLEFGKHISDHMLVCDYVRGEWKTPHIVPFGNLVANPSTLALHYGQTVFEGMKAFRMNDGRINVFRMEKHYKRFVRSLERMCMAVVPKEIFVEGITRLVQLDQAWIPEQQGNALYIRPVVFASEAKFGVKVAEEYRFIIFTGPVPALYADPIRVKVERDYIRAARGGTGYAKCGGNYGGAFLPTLQARQQGYDQVLWTDARENRFIEESGMMNVFFVINDTLVTPPLSDSILDGITRDSLLTIARDLAYKTEERPVSVEELKNAFATGAITEAFGAGTAAVVAPIGTIGIDGEDYALPAYTKMSISSRLKLKIDRLRSGREEDRFNWNYII